MLKFTSPCLLVYPVVLAQSSKNKPNVMLSPFVAYLYNTNYEPNLL